MREARVRLNEARQLVAGIPASSALLLEGQSAFDREQSSLLTGDSAEEATANLGFHLAELAASSELRIDASEGLNDSARAGPLGTVGMRVVIEGDLDGLLAILQAIALDTVRLSVTSLNISAMDGTSDPNRPEVLRAELVVNGWWMGQRPPVQQASALGADPDTALATKLDSLAAIIAEGAPFRATRTPPIIAYDLAGPTTPPPVVPMPILLLRGILRGGRGATAIVEGIPGTSGQVAVQSGDAPGDGSLRVQSIGITSITITGRDTVWRLVLKGTTP